MGESDVFCRGDNIVDGSVVYEIGGEMTKSDLGNIRDELLKNRLQQGKDSDERSGYINGVLDFYNMSKERLNENNKEV